MKSIKPCSKACVECGFTKDGTTDTLYAESFSIIDTGVIFPCHMYLKSKTGNESYGAETLDEIQVCRGFVAFIKKNLMHVVEYWRADVQYIWFNYLLNEIDDSEFENIRTFEELLDSHKALRSNTFLGNKIH